MNQVNTLENINIFKIINYLDSISSISNPTRSTSSSIATLNYTGSVFNDNSTACFDNDLGRWGGCGGCGGSNVNIINLDIDIGRRRHRRCC